MYELKTKETDVSVIEFIESVEGDAPLAAYSPRKAKISLYFAPGDEREQLLQQFGKHTTGKACVYINKLADVNEDILKALIQQTIDFLRKTYPDA